MKHSIWNRMITVLLALILVMSTVACKPSESNSTITTPKPETIDLAEPDQGGQLPTATPEQTAIPTQNPTVSSAFQDLDREIFKWYATSDGYSFHMLVEHPENYGIDRKQVVMTLGEFTEESTKEMAKEAEIYLARLNTIPRSGLSQEEQLSYDVMQQYLEGVLEDAKHPYYYEPLTEYSGLHGEIPLMFALFEIRSIEDAEDYLALFSDVPRYLSQVLAYEQARADKGLFMTEDALKAILDGCKDIIESKDNSFLYATFADAVDALTDIDDTKKAELKSANEALVKNDYINAYQTLYDGLSSLKSKCSKATPVCNQGETAGAYFAYRMQDEGNSQLTVEEFYELAKAEMFRCLSIVGEMNYEHPELYEKDINVTSGDTQTDLNDLKSMLPDLLPALPEHSLTVTAVPEELENLMSPAAYAIPAIDGWKDNTVLVNLASHDTTYLLTLAHEAYPGHLYQYVYQRGMDSLGLTQRALHYSGYAEGWAQYATQLIVENQTKYDADYVKLSFYSDMLMTIVPAVVSILVNYYGYDEKGIQSFVSAQGFTSAETLTKYWYQLAIDQPYYYFAYALGYCQLVSMVRDAATDMGEAFDQKAYLTAFLNLGPCDFNIAEERMDIWVDQQLTDGDALATAG